MQYSLIINGFESRIGSALLNRLRVLTSGKVIKTQARLISLAKSIASDSICKHVSDMSSGLIVAKFMLCFVLQKNYAELNSTSNYAFCSTAITCHSLNHVSDKKSVDFCDGKCSCSRKRTIDFFLVFFPHLKEFANSHGCPLFNKFLISAPRNVFRVEGGRGA